MNDYRVFHLWSSCETCGNRNGQVALSSRLTYNDSRFLTGKANSLTIADTTIEDTLGNKNSLILGIAVSSI